MKCCRLPLMLVAVILIATPAAHAQLTPAQAAPAASGITVSGRSAVRVHADELRFSASLFTNVSRSFGPAAATADADGAVDAIVKALRDGGIADAAAGFAGTPGPGTPRTVTGSIRRPTRAGIDDLIKRGSAAAAQFPTVQLQNVFLNFLVDDCSEPEMRAQTAALADAHARAQRVARAAGVRLGAVVTINESTLAGLNGAAACATQPDTLPQLGQSSNIGNEAAATGDVFVTVNATVTYAIAH